MEEGDNSVEALLPSSDAKKHKILGRYQKSSNYNDVMFAVAFFIHFCIIAGLSFGSGLRALFYEPAKHVIVNIDSSQHVDSSGRFTSSSFIGGIFLILFLAGFLSLTWVHLLTNLSHVIIPFTFGLIFCVCSATMSIYIAYDNYAGAIGLFSFVLALTYMYVYLRPRMDFAASTLKIACAAIRAHPATIFYSAVMVLAQIWFCLLWTTAVLGVATNEWNRSIIAGGKLYDVSSCTTYNYYKSLSIGGNNLECPNSSSSSCTVCICGGSAIAGYKTCFTPRFNGWVYFLLLFSLFWTCTVITNVIHCTTSGVVSHWWSTPTNTVEDGSPAPMKASSISGKYESAVFSIEKLKSVIEDSESKLIVTEYFVKSVSTSFGSICLGSMLVAIIKTSRAVLRFLVDKLKVQGESGAACRMIPSSSLVYPVVVTAGHCTSSLQFFVLRCLEYLLLLVEKSVDYFNRYAFCYVGIYGMTFMEASKSVVAMFKDRGVTAIVNDEIVDIILTLGHLVIAIFCSAVAYLYAYGVQLNMVDRTVLVGTGFLGGYLVCSVTMKVISAAVATVYVLYAESPDELELAVPEAFEILDSAWKQMYPTSKQPSKTSSAPQSSVIHRDLYGGVFTPAEPNPHTGYITISGKYEPSSDDGDVTDSNAFGSIESDPPAASPYGKSSGSSSWDAVKNRSSEYWNYSKLLFRAAVGENIRTGDSSMSGMSSMSTVDINSSARWGTNNNSSNSSVQYQSVPQGDENSSQPHSSRLHRVWGPPGQHHDDDEEKHCPSETPMKQDEGDYLSV